MSTQNDFTRSYKSNAAISAYTRVSVSANGSIQVAGTGNPGVGIIQNDITSNSYENAKVRMYGTGSFQILATGAPGTAGDTVYFVGLGKVDVASGGTPWVSAGSLAASYTSNGAVVEVIPAALYRTV